MADRSSLPAKPCARCGKHHTDDVALATCLFLADPDFTTVLEKSNDFGGRGDGHNAVCSVVEIDRLRALVEQQAQEIARLTRSATAWAETCRVVEDALAARPSPEEIDEALDKAQESGWFHAGFHDQLGCRAWAEARRLARLEGDKISGAPEC